MVSPVGAQIPGRLVLDEPPASAAEPPAPAGQAANEPDPDLPSVASLFLDLGQDVRRLPSLETALILGVGGASSLAVYPWDDEIVEHMVEEFGSSGFFDAGEVAGYLGVQLGAGLAVFATGRLTGSSLFSRLGSDLFRAQILNAAATHGTKALVQRRRPNGGRHSFPSGHASSTFATAAVLQRHLGWRAGVPAYALAAYTGASRLADDKHFLSDVIFGAAVGIVVGRTVTIGLGSSRVQLTPTTARGAIGLLATVR